MITLQSKGQADNVINPLLKGKIKKGNKGGGGGGGRGELEQRNYKQED